MPHRGILRRDYLDYSPRSLSYGYPKSGIRSRTQRCYPLAPRDVSDVGAPHLIRAIGDKLPNEFGVGGSLVAGWSPWCGELCSASVCGRRACACGCSSQTCLYQRDKLAPHSCNTASRKRCTSDAWIAFPCLHNIAYHDKLEL